MYKNKIFRKVLIFICFLSLFSCNKFLDKAPESLDSIDAVFQSKIKSQSYLGSVYSCIPDQFAMQNNYNLLGICDEGDFVWAAAWSGKINLGDWNSNSGFYDKWTTFYRGIRSATEFMNRIDKNDDPTLSSEMRASWKQEARALRAIYYFYLLRQYGPLVLLTDKPLSIDASVSDLQLKRSPFDTCVTFINKEFDAILANPDLPLSFTNDNDKGRIDKYTVMGFKSRLLLLAASPLWNGNSTYQSFKNSDGTALANTTYDANKWKLAADAAKVLIDAFPGHLYKKIPTGQTIFDPFISYRDVFIDRWNTEVIYARPQMASSNAADGWERHCAPRFVNGWSGVGISQQMVDTYFMNNGKTINETGSGYSENGFSVAANTYTKLGTFNMYVNREPRFYASILYNGANWIYHDTGQPYTTVELFFTGNTGKQGSHDHSVTGYLTCKNISPNSNLYIWQGDLRSEVLMRLAEIYLNYAESMNEWMDDQANRNLAVSYINMIRQRAGIPDLDVTKTQSQSAFRDAIRVERRIELAFEGFRAWDTRRWKIAEQTDAAPLMGMNVDAGTSLKDLAFYKRTVEETRIFKPSYYLWPIPQSEIMRNKACVQNPGW